MKAKIIVATASVILAVAGCASSGHAQAWGCTPAGQKAEIARLQRWVGAQSAGQGSYYLHQEGVWLNQASSACKAHHQPPPLPLGA